MNDEVILIGSDRDKLLKLSGNRLKKHSVLGLEGFFGCEKN
jgi:hypothetical protein